nr:LysE family translocator [Limobrevibacterium gyesilva]
MLLTFLATAAIFAFIPGPAMLYAAAQTMAGGRWSGLMASLGIHLGGYVHVIAAAAGLSAIFHAVPVLYMAVKLFGAGYLVWLGVSFLRARSSGDDTATGSRPRSGWRAFVESVTVEVLNPKAAIFYLAFLPQFADSSARLPLSVQLVVLGAIVNMMFSMADLVAVMLADMVTSRVRRSSRTQRLVQRTGGAVLIGLGTHLALQKS